MTKRLKNYSIKTDDDYTDIEFQVNNDELPNEIVQNFLLAVKINFTINYLNVNLNIDR